MRSKLMMLVVVVLLLANVALADVVEITDININPTLPILEDIVEIVTNGWIGYVFYISLLGSDYNISGTSIDIDVYFYDSNPGGIGLPVAGGWDNSTVVGTLFPGTYDVTSRAWITEFPFPPSTPDFSRLADTYSTSFTVTPEPITLLLLGLGGLALRRRHKA